jgi:tRNA(Arg) A34 adenosine deaminase TadA
MAESVSMCRIDRRAVLCLSLSLGVTGLAVGKRADASSGASDWDVHRAFIAEAERMKAMAVGAGDQPFGAVVVLDSVVVGFGPSRVVVDRNREAHAERTAIADGQRRLGRADLVGAILYSTSRPCSACERAAAIAQISRMIFGADATDAGAPRML